MSVAYPTLKAGASEPKLPLMYFDVLFGALLVGLGEHLVGKLTFS